MNEDQLIGLLRERQNNGGISFVTFGDLVAMVPSDQVDEWRALLARPRCTDAPRDAEEDRGSADPDRSPLRGEGRDGGSFLEGESAERRTDVAMEEHVLVGEDLFQRRVERDALEPLP